MIAAAPKVYFEADIGLFAQAWVAVAMISSGLNLERTPWTDAFTDEEYEALSDSLSRIGLTIEQALVYKPWVVALLLQGTEVNAGGYSVTAGVELTIQKDLPRDRAAYLETATQQLRLFSDGTEDEQLAILRAQVARPLDFASLDLLNASMRAWQSGDDETLLGLFLSDVSVAESPFVDRLLYQRNRNWIAPIEQMLADNEQDVVIVGAAHLLGERGVVELLRSAGYTVERVQ